MLVGTKKGIGHEAGRIQEGKTMRLQGWEGIVEEITDECNHQQKREDKVLVGWRAKLEKEPTLLQPYQIDEIVREVRRRLGSANQ